MKYGKQTRKNENRTGIISELVNEEEMLEDRNLIPEQYNYSCIILFISVLSNKFLIFERI